MARFGGYSAQSDAEAFINQTADGINLNTIWKNIQTALELWNKERTSVASLISYRTVNVGDAIPQGVVPDHFELSSEYGVPQSIREPATALKIGYMFREYDLAIRSSWRFMRDATSEQVYSSFNRAFEADNSLVTGTVLRRLFNPAPETNDHTLTCYGLWNNDGIAPMPHMGNRFDGTHSHYVTSGATQIDSGDVEGLIAHVKHHGYTRNGAARLVILANPYDGEFIQSWRAGEESRAGGPKARHDFIHSSTAIPFLTDLHIVGEEPPTEFGGLEVQGSYGGAWLIQTDAVPQGWFTVVASSGANSKENPIAIREHAKPEYQGLLTIPGNGKYPIIESFLNRGFGVGTRHRGAAAVCQITTDGSYTAPTDDKFGLRAA